MSQFDGITLHLLKVLFSRGIADIPTMDEAIYETSIHFPDASLETIQQCADNGVQWVAEHEEEVFALCRGRNASGKGGESMITSIAEDTAKRASQPAKKETRCG